MANNYLITGAKGAGKTTLLARLLRQLDLKTAGFTVKRINARNGRPLLFELRQAAELKEKGAAGLKSRADLNFSAASKVEADQADAEKCQKIFAYRENTKEKFRVKADVFNNLGLELLRQQGEVVVMDELGRFELKAQKFQKEVFSLLASEKIVIGVLKAESNPFLDRIRERDDLNIYQLKDQNEGQKADIFNKLLEDLKNIAAVKL